MLVLEHLNEMVDKMIIKVLTTQEIMTSSSLDLENTLLDGQEQHIKDISTKIKDEHISLALKFEPSLLRA